jgi:hypothetical protein
VQRDKRIRLIEESGIIAIVRFDRSEQLIQVAKAIKAGGVAIIEFTMTTPNALGIIEESAREFGDEVLLGAGTVLDAETARAAILAGAEFIVAPTLDPEVIEICRRYSKVVMPGALTPTEVITAWEAGADMVQVDDPHLCLLVDPEVRAHYDDGLGRRRRSRGLRRHGQRGADRDRRRRGARRAPVPAGRRHPDALVQCSRLLCGLHTQFLRQHLPACLILRQGSGALPAAGQGQHQLTMYLLA